jgi:hypothetical protein
MDDAPRSWLDRRVAEFLVPSSLAPMPDVRRRVRIFGLLGGTCLLAFAAVQALVMLSALEPELRGLANLVLAGTWMAATFGLTIPKLDPAMLPAHRALRQASRWLQWCWLGAAAIPLVVDGGAAVSFFLQVIGGLGTAAMAFWLCGLAIRLDRYALAGPFNIVGWAIPTLGFLVLVAPWTRAQAMEFTGPSASYMYGCFMFLALVAWLVVLLMFARSLFLLGVSEHLSLHGEDAGGERLDRIRAKRERMDRKASIRKPGE